jgi:hypothetical protein
MLARWWPLPARNVRPAVDERVQVPCWAASVSVSDALPASTSTSEILTKASKTLIQAPNLSNPLRTTMLGV